MKKVAVIIVTYNRLEKLKMNLQCILQQTVRPYIIYVIDNASTDGTDLYMQNYKISDPLLKYIRMNENQGGAGGFYVGIRQAYEDGVDYIWGMDDDAFLEKDALE